MFKSIGLWACPRKEAAGPGCHYSLFLFALDAEACATAKALAHAVSVGAVTNKKELKQAVPSLTRVFVSLFASPSKV
ncbi:MAG: hypothetical protein H0W61_02000 [Bacteroidetes bacterium]|nr:hypothetical protein [Bacteroidota bacterium]